MLSRLARVARTTSPCSLAGADAEPDRVGRVPDQHLGRLLRGAAVHRLVLGKTGEPRGAPPDVLVEPAVNDGRGLDARNCHVEALGAAVVDGRVLGLG